MPSPLTPEHFQLISNRRLQDAARPTDQASGDESEMAKLAKYELRRRQAQVPVAHRYASVHARSVAK